MLPTPDDVVEALSASTGLPAWLLNDSTPIDLAKVRSFFHDRIIGQVEAVDTVVDLVTLVKAGLTDPSKPLGVLFFVGPTGVGKTELAKTLAEFIFGSSERMVHLDMSEYQDYDAAQRLIGSRYGRSDGILTRRMREHPFSVVLLDEFEKAHPNVYDLMLQVFDDGRLTSAGGDLVSFRQAIVIMTSNLGASGKKRGASLGFLPRPESGPSAKDVQKALEGFFRPEFLNRIRIVHFHALDVSSMQRIARRELTQVFKRSGLARRGLTVDVDDSFFSLLMREGFSPQYGARPLKRALEQHLLLPLGRKLVASQVLPGLVQVDCRADKVQLRLIPRVDTEEVPVESLLVEGKKRDAAAELAALEARLRRCAKLTEGLKSEKEKLLAETLREDFWSLPGDAARTASRLKSAELLLTTQAELERRLEDRTRILGELRRRRDTKGMVGFLDGLSQLAQECDLLWRRLSRPRPQDQRDAFVMLRDLEGSEAAGRLEKTYLGWAARLHLDVTVLDPGLLWISGPCAYGMFYQEHGLHRFSRGRGSERQTSLARVEVIAAAENELPEKEVRLESGPLPKSKGARSWARALHLSSVTVGRRKQRPRSPIQCSGDAGVALRAGGSLSSGNAARQPDPDLLVGAGTRSPRPGHGAPQPASGRRAGR